MNNSILGFKDEYRWLSNFWPATVKFDGDTYSSVEHAYQAAKYPKEERHKFLVITAANAKRFGKMAILPSGWDENKEKLMLQLVREKFNNNAELKQKLIDTGDAYLEETNWWKDTFWGVCNGDGQNVLGKILMKVRKELTSQ